MQIGDVVIQAIVQGVTEFLPVSSSGHLLLAQHVLEIRQSSLFFDVILHFGTFISILIVYFKQIIKLISALFFILRDIFTGGFNFYKTDKNKKMVLMLILGVMPLFLIFVPVPMFKNIKGFANFLSNSGNIIPVGICLMITGFLLMLGTKINKISSLRQINRAKITGAKNFSVKDALSVGFMQFISAIFPGLSRSGATVSVALMRGIDRRTAVDYSFLLSMPTILAAFCLELKDAVQSGVVITVSTVQILLGILISAVVGVLSINLFRWVLVNNKVNIFIVYTFVLGLITVILGLLEL